MDYRELLAKESHMASPLAKELQYIGSFVEGSIKLSSSVGPWPKMDRK